MPDGSSLLAVLMPALLCVPLSVAPPMPTQWRRATLTKAASPGARESMMLRPGPSYSPAAYFSADYDRYKKFAGQKGVRQRRVTRPSYGAIAHGGRPGQASSRRPGVPPISWTILSMVSSSAGAARDTSQSRGH